jgi:peptide chain release factor 1
MLDWASLAQEYDQLFPKLADTSLDSRSRADMQRRSSQLRSLLDLHEKIVVSQRAIEEATLQRDKEEGEMRSLYDEEIAQHQANLVEVQSELDDILYPPDARDKRSVFVEIRAGAGGQEASLFAADLFRMYSNYAIRKNWEVSVVEESQTDLGGFKELVMHIKGKNVYRFLKHESGVHRVQRVPKTETAGRVHTSTVTVAVLPEPDDVDVTINPNDLRIDTYRAGGAGGQHVNRTDSAVRITHIPSGLVVACQDERSQLKNKQKAMKVLQARLSEQEEAKRAAAMSATRKQQVGSGERSEKIRTYNFPQNRISDHRIELTLKKLDIMMEGDIDDLISPLVEWDMLERRKQQNTLIQK